jgi:hypothetical protein
VGAFVKELMLGREISSDTTLPLGAIGKAITLPLGAITSTFALMGKRRSGKSYCGTLLFEQMYPHAQVVAIDPVAVWWGLRLPREGKGVGLDIPIFGGDHGDLPLEPLGGALLARTIVERHLSAIIDVSNFEPPQMKRFVTDFAKALFELKKRDRSAMHLFVEEAAMFMPQDKEDGQDPPMLAAFKKIIRQGGNFGIGVTLLDQRPQDVNKKVLNQTELLLAFQLIGTHERKAIEAWVREREVPGAAQLAQLAKLQPGEAFLWSPALLHNYFGLVKVREKTTFDVKPQTVGGAEAQRVVARPLDSTALAALRAQMAESVTRAEAEDPKLLRQRIAQLEKQLRVAAIQAPPAVKVVSPAAPPKIIEVPVLTDAQAARLERAATSCEQAGERLGREAATLRERLAKATRAGTNHVVVEDRPFRTTAQTPAERRAVVQESLRKLAAPIAPAVPSFGVAEDLKSGAWRMLLELARAHPQYVSRDQLGTLTGFASRGGTFGNYLGMLKRNGFVVEEDGLSITPAGLAAVGKHRPSRPLTTEEVLRLWLPRFKSGAATMLQQIAHRFPEGFSREELGALTGFEHTGGTFGNYVGMLKRNGLIVERDQRLIASAALFPGG